MKKFLRFIVILLVVIIAAVLILGAVEPTDITVTRSAIIKAPKEAVFEQMSKFHNWPHWSPWYKLDTSAKMEYFGTDGQPGSGYTWKGNDKVGEGKMTNVGVNGTQTDFELKFIKPFESEAKGFLKAEDTMGMTKATWTFNTHMKYPMNAMLVFMNMDKMLGKDFENGLNNMKTYVESNPTNGSDVVIKEVDFPEHLYAGVRKTVGMNDIGKFCMETYPMVAKLLGSKINGNAQSIYYTWDTTTHKTDMAAVFPVSDTVIHVKDVSFMRLPASKAYMATHTGGYGSIMKEHEALHKYMASKGKVMGVCVEENVESAPKEADSNKYVTNIYYMVK